MKHCQGCGQNRRQSDQYLCRQCWFTLPSKTRGLLGIRGEEARRHLRGLFRAIHLGVKLPEITPKVLLDEGR